MTKEKKVKVAIHKLKPGLYVDLELHWSKHPFLFRRFKIKSANEIAIMRELGLIEVAVYPGRSSASVDKEEAKQADAAVDKNAMWETKNQRIEEAANYRSQRNKRSREYAERVKQIKNLSANLKSAPANASRDAREIAGTMAEAFDEASDVLINLVNFTDDRFSVHHHSVNVAVLSLSLGKALGITGRELRWLCTGALLHDMGNIAIPAKVINKRSDLTVSERKLMNTHPVLGGKLARNLEGISDEVAEIIDQHHEHLDGSGFPRGLKGEEISQLARIIAISNYYDNLCNPKEQKNAITPKAAMSILFAKYKEKLDSTIVQHFVQAMGIYPPGTVVQLSDGSIGLVTAVHSKTLLQPQILLYHPDIPKSEALHLDLRLHPELTITDALKQGDYPARIYEYLGINERTAYYYEQN